MELGYIGWGILLVMNLIGFASMGIDKKRAIRKEWRIPEKTLFLFCLLGGGLGSTFGMYTFRHKTKHWYFKYGFPLIAFIEYGAIFYLLGWLN